MKYTTVLHHASFVGKHGQRSCVDILVNVVKTSDDTFHLWIEKDSADDLWQHSLDTLFDIGLTKPRLDNLIKILEGVRDGSR